MLEDINKRYRIQKGQSTRTIQRNRQRRVHKTKKNNTICTGHQYKQTNTNNSNKILRFENSTRNNIL